ncbi:ABC transporter substrate binding protein [uncultured Acetobacteroides sp.]|uniref:ABC transporter substrate binding protein n=1 Tax=uncultured Acetobacteroides sp. TaxID=1760811 RepID=UPI0029F498CB|nr:ABC transporter substrate binding protein [uncultured Acetobacteroides sp.]
MGGLRNYVALNFLMLIALLAYIPDSWALPRKQKVLVIHSYHQGLNWTDSITAGIQSVLSRQKNVEIHFEYLDTKRNYHPEYMKELLALYKRKLYNIPFKVIIVSDDNAFDFIRQFRDVYYPNIPVVFCGVNQYRPDLLAGMKGITGVSEENDFQHTIELMLRLHSNLDTVFVVDDHQQPMSSINKRKIDEARRILKTSVKFVFLKNVKLGEMLNEVASLKGRKAILLNNYTKDKDGNYISFDENMQLIRERAKVPIYSTWNFYLGEGIVGGMLTSGYKQGQLSAQLALKILMGSKADSLPVIRTGYNAYEFDYNQLNRFGIDLSMLPPGSLIVNKPPTFFEHHRVAIFVSIVSILLIINTIIISYLKRKRRERKLIQQNEELERRVLQRTLEVQKTNEVLEAQKGQMLLQNMELEKHRHHLLELVEERTNNLEHAHAMLHNSHQRLTNILDASSEGFWEYNLETQDLHFSSKIWDALGYRSNEYVNSLEFIDSLIHPDDLIRVKQSIDDCICGKKVFYKEENRIRAKDGHYLWLLSRGKIIENGSDGSRYFVGTHVDITQQKIAEQQLLEDERVLRASELRWRSLFEQTEAAILLLNDNAEILDCNPSAKILLNLNDDVENKHFEDFVPSIKQLLLFNQDVRKDALFPDKSESTLSLLDGTVMPVEVAISNITIEDKQVKMVLLRDITERKVAEREVLNAVIDAEERERQRFSKDLHDSIGPLLSALNLYITALSKDGSKERHEQAYALAKETLNETIKSIREVSNNLSPQSLTDFGLQVALRSFVQRLRMDDSLNINLDLELGSNRYSIPIEVGLYRVVTELINNTLKHAHATEIIVKILELNGSIKLDYSDNGVGFSLTDVSRKGGHGLSNISSRIRSINGLVRLWSREGKGMRVTLEVPIKYTS